MTASRKTLLLILTLKAVLAALLIAFLGIDLAPDEAQYWTWSQDLALGYYSKPPAISWQIALTTLLFGNTVFGVRIGAVLLNFCLPLVVYQTVKESPKWAFWSALFVAFCPFGIFFSFPATTDMGMILFFTLATLAVYKGQRFLLAGLYIFLAALFKWSAFSFWVFPALFALFDKRYRKSTLLAGVAISLLALTPSFVWNLTHDFATFKHVGSTLYKTGSTGHKGGNFFDFLAAQIGLLSPVFFAFLCIALARLCKKRPSSDFVFLALFPLALFLFLALALFKKMQPNWALFLFPAALTLAAYEGIRHRFWRHFGLYLSIGFSALALCIPLIQSHALLPLPYKLNPFRQTLGWRALPAALQQVGYNPQSDFLFGDKYQTASLLSFYSPRQKRAYFFNLNQRRKNQFSYWPQMDEKEIGQSGYFLVTENTNEFEKALPWYETHYKKQLAPYFSSVEVAGVFPLFKANNQIVKFALLFRCTNYNGKLPPTSSAY